MNDESSEEEQDEKVSEEVLQRREELGIWIKFCKTKIEKIEKVWNKKLEDPTHDDSEEGTAGAHSEDDEEEISFEQNIDRMFSGNQKRGNHLHRSEVSHQKRNDVTDDLNRAIESLKPLAKDDNSLIAAKVEDLAEVKEFAQNNYWRRLESYDLDELELPE